MTTPNANLFAHFQQQFHRRGGQVALTATDLAPITYAALDERSARMARCLSDLGLVPGDRVSVQVAKSPAALCLYLACLRAGLVFHPLNPAYTATEMQFFLGDARPSVLVCDPADETKLAPLCRESGTQHCLTLDGDGSGTLSDAAAGASADFPVVERAPDDLACLIYSSGTTGRPKGIMLSHDNLLSNGETLVSSWGFSDRDVLLHALPIFHVHGLFVALSCTFLSGAALRWLPSFQVDSVLRELPFSTCMMGVPTYYTRLLDDPRFDRDCAAPLRLFVSGSAPLREETFHAFEARTGQRILERYGMTETGMNTANPLHGERRAGTVGPPLPGVAVRVVNAAGEAVAADEVGAIQVRGRNVFQGYWGLPEKTAEDFTDDGFFNTGDTGLIDSQGYVQIAGRAKDLVISGGLNVYPREVELLLDALPEVVESAVIGVPHRDFGEAVVAVLVLQPGCEPPTEASVIAELRGDLSGYKLPKRVLVLDALPRNTMGKVQKNVLREQFAELFTGD